MYQIGLLLTHTDCDVTSFNKLSGWGSVTSSSGSISTSSCLTITSCSIESSSSPSDINMVSSVPLLSAIWHKYWQFLLNVFPLYFYNETWFFSSFYYNSWFPSFTIQHADFFTNVKVFQWYWMLVIILGLILLILMYLFNVTFIICSWFYL